MGWHFTCTTAALVCVVAYLQPALSLDSREKASQQAVPASTGNGEARDLESKSHLAWLSLEPCTHVRSYTDTCTPHPLLVCVCACV
jgi:hypothetical protein